MADKFRQKSRSIPTTSSGMGMGNGGLNDDASYDVHRHLDEFWQFQMDNIDKMEPTEFRDPKVSQELPLARIKKIMKLDEDVKTQMISAEAPVLFAKACEMFIEELTLRAWVHTEDNKRKTLQKNDIAMAISKHDQFDFLIDIVPREEIMKSVGGAASSSSPPTGVKKERNVMSPVAENQLPMFVQVATPTTPGLVTQPTVQTIQLQNGQILQAQTMGNQAMQLVQGANGELQLVNIAGNVQSAPAQVLHTASIAQHQSHQETLAQSSSSFPQAYQQIVAPDGTVHHLPIQLSPAQMNYLKQHLNNSGGGGGQQQVHIIQGASASNIGSPQRSQGQQQTAFFLQTTGPIGQSQQPQAVQLQMVSAEHEDLETETTAP